MNFDFLKISSVSDILGKYNVSWLTTGWLTITAPSLDIYLPIIIQLTFIVFTQAVAFAVDFLRLRYLSQKTVTKVTVEENKVELETKKIDEENENFL